MSTGHAEPETKNPLAVRLREVLASKRVPNASAWCIKAGVPLSLLSTFFVRASRNAKASISTNNVMKLAEAAKVPFEWLSGALGAIPLPQADSPLNDFPPMPKDRSMAELDLIGRPLLFGERETGLIRSLLHTLNTDFDGDTSKLADAMECDLAHLESILVGNIRPSKAFENRFEEIGGEVHWGVQVQVNPSALMLLVQSASDLLKRTASGLDTRRQGMQLADEILRMFSQYIEEDETNDLEEAAKLALERHSRRIR